MEVDNGSSPRVRETVDQRGHGGSFSRFIPACAGNSGDAILTYRFPAVHPRVCGEQPRVIVINSRKTGSSPRVRGTADPRDRVIS